MNLDEVCACSASVVFWKSDLIAALCCEIAEFHSLSLSHLAVSSEISHELTDLISRCLLERTVTLLPLLLLYKTASPQIHSLNSSLDQQPLSTRFQVMQVLNKLHLLLLRHGDRPLNSASSLFLLLNHHPLSPPLLLR